MKESPILMAQWTSWATLRGEKTETRRLVKRPSRAGRHSFEEGMKASAERGWVGVMQRGPCDGVEWYVRSPYGEAGDLLYVRETWGREVDTDRVVFLADYHESPAAIVERWRPSLHLRKADSRLWLRVEEVRIERLQSMTEAAAFAEGIDLCANPRARFQEEWDALNAKRFDGAGAWSANPWVWVVRYSVASTTGRDGVTP